MMHLWKHLLCTALCLCLLFSAALAEAVDINLHVTADYSDADATIIRSGQVTGDSLYLLVGGVYGIVEEGGVKLQRWTAGMSGPETVLENLLSYRSEDADAAMPVVSRLITDGKSVYGYDDMTGQLVRLVDESGEREGRIAVHAGDGGGGKIRRWRLLRQLRQRHVRAEWRSGEAGGELRRGRKQLCCGTLRAGHRQADWQERGRQHAAHAMLL